MRATRPKEPPYGMRHFLVGSRGLPSGATTSFADAAVAFVFLRAHVGSAEIPCRASNRKLRGSRTDAKYQVTAAFAGAEGRYEDWVYLKMMEREWKRPVLDSDRFSGISSNDGPSPRASIVLLFWSYFETRINRLLRAGLQEVPQRLLDDTLADILRLALA